MLFFLDCLIDCLVAAHMAALSPCTSSMFVCASQVLDEEPHQHET